MPTTSRSSSATANAWVSFEIHPWQRSDLDAMPVELPIVDRRVVRSSTGHEEQRLVVATTIQVVGHDLSAELTLANRDEMGFRMLVGREAMRGALLDRSWPLVSRRATVAQDAASQPDSDRGMTD